MFKILIKQHETTKLLYKNEQKDKALSFWKDELQEIEPSNQVLVLEDDEKGEVLKRAICDYKSKDWKEY